MIAMEYVEGGELFDYIVEKKRLPEKEARKIFRQLVSALRYCHANAIVHRGMFLDCINCVTRPQT
jgi:serine/threonine protein kinase